MNFRVISFLPAELVLLPVFCCKRIHIRRKQAWKPGDFFFSCSSQSYIFHFLFFFFFYWNWVKKGTLQERWRWVSWSNETFAVEKCCLLWEKSQLSLLIFCHYLLFYLVVPLGKWNFFFFFFREITEDYICFCVYACLCLILFMQINLLWTELMHNEFF